MRKTITMIIILTIAIVFAVPAYAAGSVPSVWAQSEVNEAIRLGIVPERLQSEYQKPITREEYAELAERSILLTAKADPEEHEQLSHRFTGKLTPEVLIKNVKAPSFEDCNLAHVKAAYILGLVNGVSDTRFNPNANITRQEAATLMANYIQAADLGMTYGNAEKVYDDKSKIAPWAFDAVDICYGAGVMKGTGTGFSPLGTYTREQAIISVKRAHKPFTSWIYLRGQIMMSINEIDRGWSVGKDWVALAYQTDKEVTDDEQEIWHGVCDSFKAARFDATTNQFHLFLSTFSALIFPVEEVKKEETFAVDSDYLISEWFGADYLIKYNFVHNLGYISRENGNVYFSRQKLRATAEVLPKTE